MIPNVKEKKQRTKIKITTDDRPGNMTNSYENIDSGDIGKIIKYEDKYKTLILQLDNGKSTNITYGTFKRSWRQVNENISENK